MAESGSGGWSATGGWWKAIRAGGVLPQRGERGVGLTRWKRRHNSSHAKIRCIGEQAMAALKGSRLLRKLRFTDIVKAVLALHRAST
ncbi:hypothetical protein [Streptomyces sp. NPDC002913]